MTPSWPSLYACWALQKLFGCLPVKKWYSRARRGGVVLQEAEEKAKQEEGDGSILTALLNVLRNMFPDNIVSAAVDMNILGVITFSLFFGICLVGLGDEAGPLIQAISVRSFPSPVP